MSDILALTDRRAYFIDVKGKEGKLSPDQHEFGKSVILAGSGYIVARSIENVQKKSTCSRTLLV